MLKFFKDWYDTHLTDPNQVALALLVLFITLITYILLATVVPILVAINILLRSFGSPRIDSVSIPLHLIC